MGLCKSMSLPEQIGELAFATGTGTCGFTCTTYGKGVPGQPLARGIIAYSTFTEEIVVFTRPSVIVPEVCPATAGLLIPVTAARLQVKVAVGTFEVIVY